MLNRQQVREVDRRAVDEYGISGLLLMENAGRGVTDKLCQFGVDGLVVVCCGKGNNGGDGFVIARHLDLRRLAVQVLLFAEPDELTGDAAANFHILEKCEVPIAVLAEAADVARLEHEFAKAAWIVDALLGTGATGEPRPPYDAAIARINASGKQVLAVDLPSGLDCDTGQPAMNTIRATHTCTFVAVKPGFIVPGADEFTGQVHVLDIGAPRKLVDEISGIGAQP
ncbi:MAG TPA: NAD(P)H-hydrate epimerase [Pirellulales bacterium]|jgi:NAD(P)H-hydrate epimerase|nr:NAD(P)H-hydrate epimerase [Pirellulales bacterium]